MEPPTSRIFTFERSVRDALLAANGVVDVAEALLAAVDAGLCRGMRLYTLTRSGAPVAIGVRGEIREPNPAELLSLDREAVRMPGGLLGWPLHDDQVLGLAIISMSDEPPEPLREALAMAAVALRRAIASDRARWEAAALRETLPLLSDGVMLITADSDVIFYSKRIEAMTGWSVDDVREHGWTNLVYSAEERGEVQKAIAALILGQPSRGAHRPLTTKAGHKVVAEIWSRVIPNPARGQPGLLGVLRDVTDTEAARRSAAREESLARLGGLARGIAHDFNNLLCALAGHAELIEAAATDPFVKRSAQTQLAAADKGARLARQLLAFGGPGSTRVSHVKASAAVLSTCELYRGLAPKTVRVIVEATDDSAIEADPGQIHQMLLNVLTNAGQAMPDGGRIRVRAEAWPLPTGLTWQSTTAPAPGSPMVRFAIEDDGVGFPPVPPEQLFEPFYTTKPEGHGVGLAAVQGVLANHGGGVRLSPGTGPAERPGALVELFLPRSDRPELAWDELARPSGNGEGRVWVLDDQAQILEFSMISLNARGFDARVFSSVAAMVDAASKADLQARPRVVVLDVVMNDGGGPEALRQLHALGVTPQVLWVSGYTPDDVADVVKDGAFLAKPYTGSALADAVVRLVRS